MVLVSPSEPIDRLSMVYDSLRELKCELSEHGQELLRTENKIYHAQGELEEAESTIGAIRIEIRNSLERVENLMSLMEQHAIVVVPASVDEIKATQKRDERLKSL